ncbi:MAG: bacterial Ig-like domain-containing protein [Acholeplasmatales bacterium]|nr:bacterial Ig-like domain-containing protein [Acholeplasmatales bacterium]
MNVRKKIKYLSITGLSLLGFLSLASCGKTINVTGGTSPSNSGIADNDDSFTTSSAHVSETGFNFDTAYLSSTNINTNAARTTFFLGEEFSSEGVVVEANYMQTIDGQRVTETLVSTDFTVDSSDVDMYNLGEYPVEVTYRNKATVYTKTYTIKVISSELSASGLEYVGGIELKYNGMPYISVGKGSTFTLDYSKFSLTEHIFVGEEETKTKAVTDSFDGTGAVKINASKVSTDKFGNYVVSVEYTATPVVVGDKTVSYTIKSFIFAKVEDVITDFTFATGTTTLNAAADTLDFSDWKFNVTRQSSGLQVVDYNSNDFKVTGITPFILGTQKATVEYTGTDIKVEVDVTIVASEKYNIYLGNIYAGGEVWKDDVATSAEDVALDSTGIFKITKPAGYTNASGRLDGEGKSKDKYGDLISFGARPKINKAECYISVEMAKAGTIVIYAATSGSTEREIVVVDAKTDGKTVGSFKVPETKAIVSYSVKVDKPGTYYIQCLKDGAYLHGVVAAVEK